MCYDISNKIFLLWHSVSGIGHIWPETNHQFLKYLQVLYVLQSIMMTFKHQGSFMGSHRTVHKLNYLNFFNIQNGISQFTQLLNLLFKKKKKTKLNFVQLASRQWMLSFSYFVTYTALSISQNSLSLLPVKKEQSFV